MKDTDEFIVFGAPDVQQAEVDEVVATLHSGWLGTGPRVKRFEEAFAAHKGVPAERVCGLNSCTAALNLAMVLSDLQPGDEVITTPLTFCSTVNSIIHAGATPVLADVESESMNIDPDAVEAAINERTRAILPVHYAGRPCSMDRLTEIAVRHDLVIVEDCAHAIEARFDGTPVGTFGAFGCFSFYVTKNVATGDGGMLIGRCAASMKRAKVLSMQGMSDDAWQRFSRRGFGHHRVVELGYKYNMMDLQAALGIHQLDRVASNWRRRAEIWARYDEAFASLPLVTPATTGERERHAHHLYTVLVDESRTSRLAFIESLSRLGVGAGVHYTPIPEHPYYRERFGWRPEDVPVATEIGRRTASLPLSPVLTDAQVEAVISAVSQASTGNGAPA